MKPKQVVCITPVNDPEQVLRFYQDVLGLETSDIEDRIISLEQKIVEITWVNSTENYFNLMAKPLGLTSDGMKFKK